MTQASNEEIFYNDGFKLLKEETKGNPDTDSIFSALKKMYHSIDQLIEALVTYAEKQGIGTACHKGCEWCCHQAVFANSYEIHYLSEYIKSTFPEEKRTDALQKAIQKNKHVSQLSESQMLQYKSACPLLINGACSAYAARPMACRIYLSTKLETCLEFFHHPDNEANFPALLDFPLIAGKMMNEGFSAALKEHGIETAEFRLEEGLSIALQENWSENPVK